MIESELLPALGDGSGKIVLCASTCDPDRIAALGERVAARGLRLLDTPVSGTSEQVRRGEGVGLIGGEAPTVAEVEPVLRALFPRYFHIGKVGDGGRAKLAVNLILGLNRLALAEGLVFAERLGFDLEAFLAVAQRLGRLFAGHGHQRSEDGAAAIFRPKAAHARPQGRPPHAGSGRTGGSGLPLLEVHADVLAACLRHGEGELDNSVVIEEIRRRTRPKS